MQFTGMREGEMKTFLACLGAAILQVCLGWMPASADDLLPANHNWSGVYVGGQIGGFWSNIDGSFVNFPGVSFNSGPSGGIGGAVLGFQHEIGPIVLGVEGDYLDTFDDDGSDTCHPLAGCVAGATSQGKIGRMWTVGPRLGWDSGRWLPYVTGGYATAAIRNTFADSAATNISDNRFQGWYIGGGIDMALSGNWKLGVEYRHYEFDDKSITPILNLTGAPLPLNRWTLDPDADSVTARLTYVFGCESDEPAPLK
jgi:outer membrane immunogenic protein